MPGIPIERKRMKYISGKNKITFGFTLLFSVLSAGGMVFVAIILQQLIDIATEQNQEKFWKMIFITVIYLIALSLVTYIYNLCTKRVIKNYIFDIRQRAFCGIMNLKYEEYSKGNYTSEYISVLTNDIKLIEENGLLPFLSLVQNIAMFVITLLCLCYISITVTVVLILLTVLLLIIPGVFGKILEKKQKKYSEQLTKYTETVKDYLTGLELIKAFKIQNNILDDYLVQNKKLTQSKYSSDKSMALNEAIANLLSVAIILSVVFISTYSIIKGKMSMGMMIALIQLSSMFIQPIMIIFNSIAKVKGVKLVSCKVEELAKIEKTDVKGFQPHFSKSITFNNVSFGYDKEKHILSNVNLQIKKGEKYAIIGGSGCGKTTLIKLLLGYYTDFQGEIKYDEDDIRKLNTNELSDIVSMIHQNIFLFNGTVKENICLYKDVTDKELQYALENSGLGFENENSQLMNKEVVENGENLSGGQKQRIAVARAIIRNPQLLVLDEGTSAIDSQTASDIENRLFGLDNLTIIAITHKLNRPLLEKYDKIIFLSDGVVAAVGEYKELLKDNKQFKKFVEADS